MEKPLHAPRINRKFRDENPEVSTFLERIPDKIPRTNIYTETINPTSVAANTVERQTFTVEGIDRDDSITIENPELPSGLEMLASYRASADNTIEIPFWNTTGSPIDAGNIEIKIVAVR